MRLFLPVLLGFALAAPVSVPAQTNPFGGPPLVEAAKSGDLAEVRKFLLLGENPNRAGTDKMTPLMHAANQGRADIAVALLRAEAWLDLRDRDGNTALIWAASNGSALVVTLLADAGANVDMADNQGKTALMKAATAGHDKVVDALIKLGANVELADYTGKSAIAWARQERHWPIVRRLHRAGAKLLETTQ